MTLMRPVLTAIFLLASSSLGLSAEDFSIFFSPATKLEPVFQEEVQGLGSNFSGVTFVPSRNHYLILDDSCKIFEIKIEGKKVTPVRTIPLIGFKDCEAIAYLAAQSKPDSLRLAVAEEGRGSIALLDLKDHVPLVVREQAKIFSVDRMTSFFRGNSGLEALAVDDAFKNHPVFYFGKEEYPRRIYQGLFNKAHELVVIQPWNAEEKLPKGSDIAELCFFEGRLLVLDQRGGMIRQVHPRTGDLLSEYKLPPSGWNKYEGMTVVRRGEGLYDMLIVAEKHRVLFYRMQKK